MSEQSEFKFKEIETFEAKRTIKGYPELHWTGKRPFKSTQYFPAQLKEQYGEAKDGWMNKIFWGDNLQVMSHLLKEYRGKIKLIFIDPPFDSKADYKMTIKLKDKMITNDINAFEEKQYTDIWNNDEYLQFVYERLILMRELLCDNGSIYLQCDWRKSHHLRCIMDEVFGIDNFKNEIIWSFVKGASAKSAFGRKHQNILYYSKSSECYFNLDAVRVAYSEETIARAKRGEARYKNTDVEEMSDKGKNPGDVWSEKELKETDKWIEMESKESDVWEDVFPIQGNSIQNTNYPTQKPEALLERIIKASTENGDLVFDCFMGSGTTQAVAMKLGRRFIGADINLGAVQTTTRRLLNIDKVKNRLDEMYFGFEVYNVNNYDFFRNEIEAKELLIEALEIQSMDSGSIYDGEKDGRMVKILPVNRIATKADLEELKSNLPYKTFEKRKAESPNEPVEKILLVCMGHEPDLKSSLEQELSNYKIDIEIVDILRDKSMLELKRDSEAEVVKEGNKLIIRNFYPMNLLQKMSLMKETVEDWKVMVESIMIDWNYDGVVMQPSITDVPEKNGLVIGEYEIPEDAGTIKVKITDVLSESLEMEV